MSCFEQTTIIIGLIISFFVAVGTISLAIFAFRQIKGINKEYKKKQLNEILEWAKSAIDWKYTEEYTYKDEHSSQQVFNLYISFSLKGESLSDIQRTGDILTKTTLALKQPSLDKKIRVLGEEIIKTHRKLELLRNATYDALAKKAKGLTTEIIASKNALNLQMPNHKNAAENLIAEIGKLIPSY
ncbi:hypothetical protein ES707_02221 [subsurface metagenome]